MKIIKTDLPGVLIIEPRVFEDERGFFKETYSAHRYFEAGIDLPFVQDNLSRSEKGTLRGLHYQIRHAQGKLVQVVRGEIFDVAVDMRKDSPQFGKWYGTILSETNHRQMYVPPGFAHGFCVLSPIADMNYKCTDTYHPEHERTLLWNDPDVAVDWPVNENLILSEKDRNGKTLREVECYETDPLQ